ncbi:MAG: adenylate kinase family protein [Candidatus Aenigmarchaeota archaeon]|nr:adenylate kinase family protein [Candidatus Aenigmarchaeota archaeon]
MILAITGTPGAGKTAVGKELAKLLGWKFVELNRIAESKQLYSGYDHARKCWIVDLKKLQKFAAGLAGNAIMESHYAHELQADAIVVLRCKPKQLIARLRKRGWSKQKIAENVEAEIMEICLAEARESGKPVIVADSSGRDAGKTAATIGRKLAALGRLAGRRASANGKPKQVRGQQSGRKSSAGWP